MSERDRLLVEALATRAGPGRPASRLAWPRSSAYRAFRTTMGTVVLGRYEDCQSN